MRHAILGLLAVGALACIVPEIPNGVVACAGNSECPPDFVCRSDAPGASAQRFCFDIGGEAGTGSGPGRVSGEFILNGDDTITDSRNGLNWQKFAPDTRTWSGAAAYCAGLSLAGTGWRLPTLTELQSLVDTRHSPTIDPIAFPDTRDWRFWSSSPDVGSIGNAWCVSFRLGTVDSIDRSFPSANVRCVR